MTETSFNDDDDGCNDNYDDDTDDCNNDNDDNDGCNENYDDNDDKNDKNIQSSEWVESETNERWICL